MPLCIGRPHGPCPDKRCDSTVKSTQGELILCPACDEFRFPSSFKSNIIKSGPLPQPLPKETVTDTDEKPKDSVMKPVTTCWEVNDVLCFVKNKYGNCQGYVPLTLDVVRVAFKVPLALHTPL